MSLTSTTEREDASPVVEGLRARPALALPTLLIGVLQLVLVLTVDWHAASSARVSSFVLIVTGFFAVLAAVYDSFKVDLLDANVLLRSRARLPSILLQILLVLASAYFQLLTSNPSESKLNRLGVSGLSLQETFANGASLLFSSLAAATVLTALPYHVKRIPVASQRAFDRHVYLALAAVGTSGLLVRLSTSRAAAFDARGEAVGQGLLTLLVWAAPVAVAYGLLFQHGKSKYLAACSVALLSLIFIDGNRSPLLLILIGATVRLFTRPKAINMITAFITALGGIFLFSLQSTWRGEVRNSPGTTIFDALYKMAENPTRTAIRSGFDTLEGTGLTDYLLEVGYRPHWWDPAIAVLNFVPRLVWPSKPKLFGSEVGVNVLGFDGAGGIFLSGPGYLLLLLGSRVAAVAAFAVLSLFTAYLLARATDPVLITIILGTFVRYVLAGDPFDIFLGLQAALIYGLARLAFSSKRRSRVNSSP